MESAEAAHGRAASGASPNPAPPAFVELVAPRAASLPECMIELEGRRGKLRIQLKNVPASYLATNGADDLPRGNRTIKVTIMLGPAREAL